MAFKGNESEIVTLAEASAWTKEYRDTITEGEIIAHFVGKNKLQKILDQDGCMGVRIYYGLDNGVKNLVFVGADANENDMVDGVILEKTLPCPPRCPDKNKLNS